MILLINSLKYSVHILKRRVLDSLQLSVDFAVGVRVLEPLPKNLKVKPLTEEEQYGWF